MGQPPVGPPQQGAPPWQPPARPPTKRNRWPIFAGAGTAAVVIIFAIAAFAGGLFNPPKPKPTPTYSPTHSATPRTGVASLTELLPGDIDDPASQCLAFKPPWTPVGMTQGLRCSDPGLPATGSLEAYQMNSYASYLKSWAAFNTWWGFSSYTPESTCPPTGTNRLTAEGTTTWYDKYFPTRRGQVFECEWTPYSSSDTSNLNQPAIAWTFPTENAFIIAWGGENTAFSTLQTWWVNDADPLTTPTPVAPSP